MDTRELTISDTLRAEIETALDAAQAKGETTATVRQKGSGGCSLEVVVGPGPTIVSWGCTGSCGFWDSVVLGRSCQKGNSGTSDGGVAVACTCRGGWWDSIFART